MKSLLTLIALTFLSSLASAYELTVNYQGKQHTFDQQQLAEIAKENLTTLTPWTDQANTYQGVFLSSLMKHLNITSTTLTAKALNDYKIEMPIEKGIEAQAFISSKMDGQPMKVRSKGPFWIIFPWTERPELNGQQYQDWAIWQLNELTFE